MAVRAHVVVSGFVQGVNFRWYTTQHARTRGVGGWVRNAPDGTVEAVFEGQQDDVDAMIEWCRVGPRHADVTSVEVTWEETQGLADFDMEF